jgi:hypothetical protein
VQGKELNQSKTTNYAKRTQFAGCPNICNASINNELQRKIDNGHLVKTNPIKPNQTQFQINDFLRIFYLASAVFYLKYLVEVDAESKRSLAGDDR